MKRSIHKVVLVYKPISNFKFSGEGYKKGGYTPTLDRALQLDFSAKQRLISKK